MSELPHSASDQSRLGPPPPGAGRTGSETLDERANDPVGLLQVVPRADRELHGTDQRDTDEHGIEHRQVRPIERQQLRQRRRSNVQRPDGRVGVPAHRPEVLGGDRALHRLGETPEDRLRARQVSRFEAVFFVLNNLKIFTKIINIM